MDYEFTELEHFVTVLITPSYLKTEKQTGEHLLQYALDCYNKIEEIKKRFTLAVFKIADENQITIYIHLHQASLTRFADAIYFYSKSNDLEKPEPSSYAKQITGLYVKIYNCLNSLLLFLEHNFTKYFAMDARLTRQSHEYFTKEIKNNVDEIKESLRLHSIDNDLIDIIDEVPTKLKITTSTITYRERDTLRTTIFELLEFIEKAENSISDEQVCNELLCLNYNTSRFFSYLILRLTEHAKELDNDVEKIMYFSSRLKSLNQLAVDPLLDINIRLPNIREQLSRWINEEIYLLEKKQQLAVSNHSKSETLPAFSKIHITLSVSQLSLALKLLIDSGIIVNNNHTDLTKIVAKSFKTDRIENISGVTLRNKYYNVERVTIDKMKDVVVNLLNQVRKY